MDNDFALEPVPSEKTVSGYRIAMVVIGVNLALPAFITGAEIGFALGFQHGFLSIFLGGVILSIIAMATGTVGARLRLNTAMIANLTFGSLGGRVVSVVLAMTCLGWFGVTAELFGRSVHQIVAEFGWHGLSSTFYVIAGGLLMVITTIFGFAALQRLSNVTVPLLAILIAYTAYITMRDRSPAVLFHSPASTADLGDGISAIVGGLAVAATIYPDLCRFSRSPGDARLAAVLTFGIALPAILLLAMIPSIMTHERDLMTIMITLGLGAPALILLIVKAWATNAGNLYSASLGAANGFSSSNQRWAIIGAGLLGIAFAVAGISERFIPFLVALGVCIPPIAGIYVVDLLWAKRSSSSFELRASMPAFNHRAFACWALGIGGAFSAKAVALDLTGIPACDSMAIAATSYALLLRLRSLQTAKTAPVSSSEENSPC